MFSPTFVVKPKTLVFKDALPRGKATYQLTVAQSKKGKKTKQLELGKATSATVTGAKTVSITIRLGTKGWATLRHNPKGKLSLLSAFKRKVKGHLLEVSRSIKPKKRPRR